MFSEPTIDIMDDLFFFFYNTKDAFRNTTYFQDKALFLEPKGLDFSAVFRPILK